LFINHPDRWNRLNTFCPVKHLVSIAILPIIWLLHIQIQTVRALGKIRRTVSRPWSCIHNRRKQLQHWLVLCSSYQVVSVRSFRYHTIVCTTWTSTNISRSAFFKTAEELIRIHTSPPHGK
jgi:hypothetical protein